MNMLDILRNRLPEGLTVIEYKERSSKYVIKFAYNGERLNGQGELLKACTPGKENLVCDTTIQTAMLGFMLDKGDYEGAIKWKDYAERAKEISEGKPEAFLELIRRHNDVVEALEKCNIPVGDKLFTAMTVWHKLACEGSAITNLAREQGVDAKCDMQSGKIYVYGSHEAAAK